MYHIRITILHTAYLRYECLHCIGGGGSNTIYALQEVGLIPVRRGSAPFPGLGTRSSAESPFSESCLRPANYLPVCSVCNGDVRCQHSTTYQHRTVISIQHPVCRSLCARELASTISTLSLSSILSTLSTLSISPPPI
jgi:hypothetical protein